MDSGKKTLVLGQGQLAAMLETRGKKLGLFQTNLDRIENPAFLPLSKSADAITFESEFFDATSIEKKLKSLADKCFPSLFCLGLLQDRLTQKQSLVKAQLPTSPFWILQTPEQLKQLLLSQKSIVAKKRQGGYDGYGTFVLKNPVDLDAFLKSHASTLSDFIFEKFIAFDEERALQVARSRSGHIEFFPMVLTVQKDKKCFYVVGPLRTPKKLMKMISQWLSKINYVGVMGIEFFYTNGEYLINEVAPRVHNTGHHTLDSCLVDQFTMHWLCQFQDKLPKVELKATAFVMLNLIGKGFHEVQFPGNLDGQLYWYNKTNRDKRKLGHINWVGENKKALLKRALLAHKKWKL